MEFDSIAAKLALLIRSGKNLYIGKTTGGNAGSRITVNLNNGTSVKALAATNIRSGNCAVLKDENTNNWIALPNTTESNIEQKDIRSVGDYKQYKQQRKEPPKKDNVKLTGKVAYIFSKKIVKTTSIICPPPKPDSPGDKGDSGDGAGAYPEPYIWANNFNNGAVNTFHPSASYAASKPINLLQNLTSGSSFSFNSATAQLDPTLWDTSRFFLVVQRGIVGSSTQTDLALSTQTDRNAGNFDAFPSWYKAAYKIFVLEIGNAQELMTWQVQIAQSSNSTDTPVGKYTYDIDYLPTYTITYLPGVIEENSTPPLVWELYKPNGGQPSDPGDEEPDNNPGSPDGSPGTNSFEIYLGGCYANPIKLFELSTNQTFSREPEILFPDKNTQICVFRIGKAGNSGAANSNGGCRVRIVVVKSGAIREIKTYRWNDTPGQSKIYLDQYNPNGIFNNYSAFNTYPIPNSYIASTVFTKQAQLTQYFKHSPEKTFYANKMLRNMKKGNDSKFAVVFIDPKSGTTTYDNAASLCIPAAFVNDALLSDTQIVKLKNENIKVDLRYFKMILGTSYASCLKEVTANRINNFKVFGAGMSSVSNADWQLLSISAAFFT